MLRPPPDGLIGPGRSLTEVGAPSGFVHALDGICCLEHNVAMTTKTRTFNELRKQARRRNPGWDEQVAERQRAMEDALALADLRRSRHVTQVQLAEVLGISQGNVSRLEGRSDVYLSTLRSYVQALGGHLEIAAVFDDERYPVAPGA